MPIIAPKLKKAIEDACFSSLESSFKDNIKDIKGGEKYLKKLAKAMSECAGPICDMLSSEVLVAPGSPVVTAGSPAAQTGTITAPGKLS
jgi:hypothetical protein